MSNAGFRIFVELSNFFSDYRSRARIFIDNNIETVGHLQHKIKELFCIKDFVFVCNNEYLPFTENIGILQPEETIWALPSSFLHDENSKIKKSKLKRKVSTTEDTSPCHSDNKRKKDKCVTENHTVIEELPENNTIESVEPEDFIGTYSQTDKLKKKKKKDKYLKTCKDSDPKPKQTSSPTSSKLEQSSPKKSEYVCKGNLAMYKKKIAVPMITDQYLKNNKINIIKIERITNGLYPIQRKNTPQENSSNLFSDSHLDKNNTAKLANVSNTTDLQEQYGTFSPLNKAVEVTSQYIQAEVPHENSQTTSAENIPEIDATEVPLNVNIKDSPMYSNKSLPKNRNIEILKNGNQEVIQMETKSDSGKPQMNNRESEDLVSLTSDDIASLNSSIQPDNSNNVLENLQQGAQLSDGSIMEQLRNTTSESASTADYQVSGKRKRKRVHKKKTKEIDPSDTPAAIPKPKPLKIKGSPSIHIKFEDEQNGHLENEELDETTSGITINKGQWKIKEEDVMKSQLMNDLKPKVGDMIAFKVVRITESYTPELSTYIIGLVEEIENDEVLLKITSGLDQCVLPKGKLTIENDAEEITPHQRFHWQSLLETRLLFP